MAVLAAGCDGAGAGAGWPACCASAGSASASTPAAINSLLARISALRHFDLDRLRGLFPGKRGEEEERAEDEQHDDDEHDQSGHGGAFAERGSRCIAPSRYGFGKASGPARRPRRADGSRKIDGRAAARPAPRSALRRQRFGDRGGRRPAVRRGLRAIRRG